MRTMFARYRVRELSCSQTERMTDGMTERSHNSASVGGVTRKEM